MIVNGTTYSSNTPEAVWKVLEDCRHTRTRVRIYYGKPDKLWGDSEVGRVGRSTGTSKIPLICHNSRSFGGDAILDDCVVGIRHANIRQHHRPWLYQHPNHKQELTDLKTSHQACKVKEDR